MRQHAVTAALVLLAVVVGIVVGPGMHARGTLVEDRVLELGAAAATNPAAQIRGPVTEDVDGYRVGGGGEAVVVLPLNLPAPGDGRTLLRVWAYGPQGVRTTAVLRAADGSERSLGRATNWVGETFDVTSAARVGTVQLRVRAENSTAQPILFLDRVAPIAAPGSLEVTAPAWSVGLFVLLAAAALLELAGRWRRHWMLPLILAPTAALVWAQIAGKSYEPLAGDSAATWDAVREASWLGFHDGVLWGSWTSVSSLAVQVFHAFTPLVGTAPVSARSAAMLTGLLAIGAIYALAYRATGRAGAGLAALLAVCAIGFTDATIAGTALPVLILAGAIFGYALHACLAAATPLAIGTLGGAAALCALAEPTWLPGALLVVAIVAFVCAERPERLKVAGVGLLTAAVCLAPHLASTASQNDGRMFATIDARAVAARNVEFVGEGHGAPTPPELARDPLSGERVSLAGYLIGDHSVSQFVGGTLAGGQDSVTAFNATDRTGVAGTLLFILAAAGALLVLLLPRLRLLVLLAPLVVAPTLFIAAQTPADPAQAGAVLWPVMLTGAAVLAYVAARFAIPLLAPHRARIEALQARIPFSRWPPGAPPAAGSHRT